MIVPRRRRNLGVAYVALGIILVLAGAPWPLLLVMFAGAGVLFWLSRRAHARNIAMQHVNRAFQNRSVGQLDEAEAELVAIDRRGMVANISSAVSVYRAWIAFQRGNPQQTIEAASKAVSEKVGILIPQSIRAQRASALSFRAFAYAAIGEISAAERDARDAEQIAEASPEAIARARLARAVVFSRTGNDVALATALSENADLFAEYGDTRARVLARSLARMVRERRKHVYREPAKLAELHAPSELAGWVEGLAPEAAAYVETARITTGSGDAASASIEPALAPAGDVKAIEQARKRASKKTRWSFRAVLWGILIFAFLATWQLLASNQSQRTNDSAAIDSTLANAQAAHALRWIGFPWAIATIVFLLICGPFIIALQRARRNSARLTIARKQLALGNVEVALPLLEAIARDKNAFLAGVATHELVRIAARDARYAFVVEQCEHAIPKLVPVVFSGASLLVPMLATELAVARAAMAHVDKARAELALIERDFASFPFLMIARARVLSMCEIASGNFEAAARIASSRPAESALPRCEELLGDLAMAAVWGAEDSESERLEAEMANPAIRGWVQAVAPGLVGLVGQIRKRAPIAQHENVEHAWIGGEVVSDTVEQAAGMFGGRF